MPTDQEAITISPQALKGHTPEEMTLVFMRLAGKADIGFDVLWVDPENCWHNVRSYGGALREIKGKLSFPLSNERAKELGLI